MMCVVGLNKSRHQAAMVPRFVTSHTVLQKLKILHQNLCILVI